MPYFYGSPMSCQYPKPELIKGKNPYAAALGRLGELKGGKACFEKLTAE